MFETRRENEMTKRIASLTSTLLLALGIAAFAGSALAGNGNGNGNGNDKAADPAASAEPVSQDTGSSAKTNNGQAKKDGASTQAKGSASQNSASVNGIKPTNSTSKGTKCSTGGGTGPSATCSPTTPNPTALTSGNGDASKRYGNGTTAAQIANSRGAPAGTTVYGPGNSQPHKVEKCPGSGKFVDVHAVKSYSAQACAAGPTTKPKTTSPTGPVVSVTAPAPGPTKTVGVSARSGVQGAPQGVSPQGGVLGVTTSKSQPAGGVLGAIEAVGEGVLPFTGFPLWAVMLVALALIAFGLALRRHARATV
jgi:hypothetical protein